MTETAAYPEMTVTRAKLIAKNPQNAVQAQLLAAQNCLFWNAKKRDNYAAAAYQTISYELHTRNLHNERERRV